MDPVSALADRSTVRAPDAAVARTGWTAAAAMVLLAVLTLPTLGRQPLSWDEAVSASSAQRSLPHLREMLAHTDAPLGCYYLLLHVWVSLGRSLGIGADTAWWLRLPSALAAVSAVGVLVVLASRYFGPQVGAMAGVLFAVHPMVGYYAQDARPYTLVTASLLVSTAALLRALERPDRPRLWIYAATVVLTLYLNLLAVFAFAAHGYLIRRQVRGRAGGWRWAVVAVGVGLAALPLGVVAYGQSAELGWIPAPTLRVVWSVVTRLAGGVPFAVVVLALAGYLLITEWHRPGGPVRMLLCAALIPPAVLVIADFGTPVLVARYGLVAVPAGATLLALAAVRYRSRVVTALVAAAGLCLAGATAVQLSHPYKYEDYRAAADRMGDLARPGSAVIFLPTSAREGYDIYAHLEPDLGNIRDLALAAGSGPVASNRIGGRDVVPAQIAARLRHSPVLFVFGDSIQTAARTLRDPVSLAQERVAAGYRIVLVQRYGDVTLTMLTRGL